MITANPEPPVDDLARRLAEKAEAIAEAHVQQAQLARRGDPRRWRRAGLLWPLFPKG